MVTILDAAMRSRCIVQGCMYGIDPKAKPADACIYCNSPRKPKDGQLFGVGVVEEMERGS